MDVSDLNKVASRKNLSAEVEKLREKVSRENRKIIKLKVAQDTAYWDVKEKLRQVESNHERLQQNMVEVQMQYETVSGQYQDELRFRPETLNKLTKTREICDVLEDYSERLRDTLSRCKADQSSLYAAYQKSGHIVRDLKDKQSRANENNRMKIDGLEERLKLATNHNAQMLQLFNMEKQRLETELNETKAKLADATRLNEEMMAAGRELNRELEKWRWQVEKKEEAINTLQNDMNRMLKEFNAQLNDMKNTVFKQEKDLKESATSISSLQQALSNQEAFTKSVVDEKTVLQDKVAALEDEQLKKDDCIRELQAALQEVYDDNEQLKKDIAALTDNKKALELQIDEKHENIKSLELDLANLKERFCALEIEKGEVEGAAANAAEEMQTLVAKVQEMTVTTVATDEKLQQLQNDFKDAKENFEKRLKQLNNIIEDKDRELKNKDSAIATVMNEVKAKCDTLNNLEVTLQNTRKEKENDRVAMMERENTFRNQIGQLEALIKNQEEESRRKEDEANKQMTVILELRSDKERLTTKILGLEGKMDNIHKELTAPTTRSLTAAEQDDNAVMLTPARKQRALVPSTDRNNFPQPAGKPRAQDVVFNFFSDASVDENSIDPELVNRRFEAMSRGEHLSPIKPAALKKRRAATPTPRNLSVQLNKKEMNMHLSAVEKKPRTFFKSKRPENKAKRSKLDEDF